MGDTFGVHHQELAAGAGGLSGLAAEAKDLLGQVRQALAGAANAAGNADLATALMEIDVLPARGVCRLVRRPRGEHPVGHRRRPRPCSVDR